MGDRNNPRCNAEGYSDPTAFEALRNLESSRMKDFIDCCIPCFTCVSWRTLRLRDG